MIGSVLVVFAGSIILDRLMQHPVSTADSRANESRLTYDELYQLNWRQTDQVGNVSVEATVFSQSLRQHLAVIDSPSLHQQAMQRVLTTIPTDAVVYYVIFAQPGPFISTLDAPATATYDNTDHPLTWVELDPLLSDQTAYGQRDGFYWVASNTQPDQLQLAIEYPVGTTHHFAWNNLIDQ